MQHSNTAGSTSSQSETQIYLKQSFLPFRSFSTLFFLLSLIFAGWNLVLFFSARSLAFATNNFIQVCHFLQNAQQWQKSQTDHYHLFSVSRFPPFVWSTMRIKKNFPEITKLFFYRHAVAQCKTLDSQSAKWKTRKLVIQEKLRFSKCKGKLEGL